MGGGGGYSLLLLDRTVECRQESIGWREGGRFGKGPKDLETGIELRSS